ncbi:MAG: hydrolase [Legionellales bacterium]
MDAISKELCELIQSNHTTMVDQLHQICAINSGTDNLPGLERVSQSLQTAFLPLADSITLKTFPKIAHIDMQGTTCLNPCGDALFISKRPHLKRRILLSGHMDTVYAASNPFQKLTYLNDNHLNGPGVADMKGGLIVMLHALSAFEHAPGAELMGWDVLINADEEIGSPASGPLFEELASQYQAGLIYEPAITASGTLARNHKGSGKFTLIATGKSAHAGRAFDEGRNAICYLAKIVTAIDALNGQKNGVTINVGKIAGGEALNVVPDKAVAKLDIRITLPEDAHWVKNALDAIQLQFKDSAYSLNIQGLFGRPVKRVDTGTIRLFERIQKIGKDLGLSLDWKDSGDCCDGNNLAQKGLPVLDTLGVRGGNIHSSDEYILLDSLVERATLSALVLVDLAQGGLEDLKS